MFERLKQKVTRRQSEPALLDLPPLPFGNRRALTSTNRTIVISDDPHPRHLPLVLRLRGSSLSSNAAALEVPGRLRLVLKKQAKELIKHETSQVVGKKLHSILADLGLQQPFPLTTSNNSLQGPQSKLIRTFVANTNDCIYLPPALLASFTYDDVENGGTVIPTGEGESGDALESDARGEFAEFELGLPAFREWEPSQLALPGELRLLALKLFYSPNHLCTEIDADLPIPHVFAFIIELTKETAVRDVKFDFQSCVLTLWPTGDPHNHYHQKEKFKIGSFEWNSSLSDADYYINTENSNDAKISKIGPNELAQRTKRYRLVSVRELADDVDPVNHPRKSFLVNQDTSTFSDAVSIASTSAPQENAKAGLYVFLLPLVFPPHMPASVTSINGSLVHRLTMSMTKISEKLNRKSKVYSFYNLPMVRTPPSLANSVADKPIYVNRVWNDAMHYIITFPKKYVALGSEHTINVKLIPLMKDVILKRIKFNVLERITYVSKDLRREYEYDSDDPYLMRNPADGKIRERVVHLCELKTKFRSNYTGAEPFKEEVIKCPDNNLLFSCYEPKDDPALDDPLAKPEKSTLIASPLDINIALPFLTTRTDKILMSASNEDPLGSASIPRRSMSLGREAIQNGQMCPSSPVIGTLETQISHHPNDAISDDVDDNVLKLDSSALMEDHKSSRENVQQGYTTAQKALAPDSNFRHIQITHRLQVSFRISKPDPKDNNRMHHYEVVVDTPLVLLSAKCNETSIQLPKYDEIGTDIIAESSAPPERRGISFRTPSYSHNGVSIKPLDPEGDDRLPSFEEAISASASPVMRSFSVAEDPLSRSNSVSFAGPAPAYEDSLPGSRVDDFIPTLQIDDLVIDSNVAPVPRKPSTIKAALGNSFAATSSASNERSDNDLSYVPHTRDDRYRDEGEPASILSSDSASEAVSSNDTMSTSTSHGSSGDRLNSHDIGSVSPRTRPHHKNGCERRNESFSHGISTMPLLKNVSVEHVGDDTAQRNELARILSTDLGDPKQLGFPHAY
uniref:Arrestin C-terminal-like domain-containing protein n=1 Tax=Candidozyma auris TaxID=498019 RepID=A0A0L0P308_CANAR